ncbi:MAG: S1C family serine protease [Armatimonadota bacterium]
MERRSRWTGAAIAAVAGAVAGACVARRDLPIPLPTAVAAPPYSASAEPIVQAVQATAPAVVAIDTTARQVYRVFDDPMDGFWGGGRREVREVPTGQGSGVLLEGGYVLTNQHVVGDAVETQGRIVVRLPDGRRFQADPVGADRSTDVALLKVRGGARLPVAPLGDADRLLPGQTVIAIGNPVGLAASVSAGVVSALGRPIDMGERIYENLIQTDTAINPGNSGGALIDLGGRVVGINTLVRSDAQNIGFAIPIKTALRVAGELRKYGKVRRPATGIIAVDLDERFRSMLELPRSTSGVLVWNLYRDSPAARAGLRRGDVLLSLGGKATPDEPTYRRVLSELRIGANVAVEVLRDGRRATTNLTLSEAP